MNTQWEVARNVWNKELVGWPVPAYEANPRPCSKINNVMFKRISVGKPCLCDNPDHGVHFFKAVNE